MTKIIFDASAIIALFAKEKGYETIKAYLKDAVISSVNVAEVYKYCLEIQNLTSEEAENLFIILGIKIINFTNQQALITAKLLNKTKSYGLSLGDRACIALAMIENSPVITCDSIWKKIDVNVEFIIAR